MTEKSMKLKSIWCVPVIALTLASSARAQNRSDVFLKNWDAEFPFDVRTNSGISVHQKGFDFRMSEKTIKPGMKLHSFLSIALILTVCQAGLCAEQSRVHAVVDLGHQFTLRR